jgi:REP element-mobilizing transposase RayT
LKGFTLRNDSPFPSFVAQGQTWFPVFSSLRQHPDDPFEAMPRRLRLQYPGAIYHLMARGNGRQDIVRDDDDRRRLLESLARAVARCSWTISAFVVLSNHFHLVLKTPRPNLARGMQAFLSAYANAWARRHRFCGHVFQGRYRTESVEDETYLWTVTRYMHLNPVRARLVEHPAAWPWSSYPGYAQGGRRLEWVAYDELIINPRTWASNRLSRRRRCATRRHGPAAPYSGGKASIVGPRVTA